ncbi:MAG: hypothetical protein ABI761_15855 [Saprospiraceae bacterium]
MNDLTESDVENKIQGSSQLARVEFKEGQISPVIIELFDKKYNHVEYSTSTIVCTERIYELKFPLLSTMDKSDDKVTIENSFLNIYAMGGNLTEAEAEFAEDFDYLFTRYNELGEDQLTDNVKVVKAFLNHIVKL